MPSKIEHEFTKLRGEVSDTGEIYTDSIAALRDAITAAEVTIKALESQENNSNTKTNAATSTAKRALSSANASLKRSGDNMSGELSMGGNPIANVQRIEFYGNNSISFWYEDTQPFAFSYNGNIVLTGTVDGRDIDTDGTKLDTIATSADVTGSNAPQAHTASHLRSGSDPITAGKISTTNPGTGANNDIYISASEKRFYAKLSGSWYRSAAMTLVE